MQSWRINSIAHANLLFRRRGCSSRSGIVSIHGCAQSSLFSGHTLYLLSYLTIISISVQNSGKFKTWTCISFWAFPFPNFGGWPLDPRAMTHWVSWLVVSPVLPLYYPCYWLKNFYLIQQVWACIFSKTLLVSPAPLFSVNISCHV